MTQDSISLSVINKIESTIRDSNEVLYLLNDHHQSIIEGLRKISVRSGMAVYVWVLDKGLTNIKTNEDPLPRTKTMLDALKYANNNHYFSVYVFPAREKQEQLELNATLSSWAQLLQVNETARYLFLLPSDGQNNYLKQKAQELDIQNKNTTLYKLRNSIWVLTDE